MDHSVFERVLKTGGRGFAGHSRNILFAIASFSLFWTWQTCLLYLPVLRQSSEAQHSVWLTGGLATATLYLAAALLSRFLTQSISRTPIRVLSVAIMSITTAIQIAFTASWPFADPSSLDWSLLHFARSAGSVLYAIQLAHALASFPSKSDRRLIVFAGTVLSLLLYLLIDNLASAVAGIIVCLIPFLASIASEQRIRKISDTFEEKHSGDREIATPRNKLLAFFIFGMSINYIRGSVERGSLMPFDNSSIIALTLVIVLVGIVSTIAFKKVQLRFVTVACITASIFLDILGALDFALPFVSAGMFLYIIIFWQTTVSDAALVPGSVTRTFAFGFGIYGVGLAIGSNLSQATVLLPAGFAQTFPLFVAYALLLAGFSIMGSTNETPTVAEIPPADDSAEKSDLEACLDKYCELIAAENALTPQEKRVLCEMARSKSLQAIAEEFGVSVNTVKTHASHIYQKLDTHSREELMRLVIERSRSDLRTGKPR